MRTKPASPSCGHAVSAETTNSFLPVSKHTDTNRRPVAAEEQTHRHAFMKAAASCWISTREKENKWLITTKHTREEKVGREEVRTGWMNKAEEERKGRKLAEEGSRRYIIMCWCSFTTAVML